MRPEQLLSLLHSMLVVYGWLVLQLSDPDITYGPPSDR